MTMCSKRPVTDVHPPAAMEVAQSRETGCALHLSGAAPRPGISEKQIRVRSSINKTASNRSKAVITSESKSKKDVIS